MQRNNYIHGEPRKKAAFLWDALLARMTNRNLEIIEAIFRSKSNEVLANALLNISKGNLLLKSNPLTV